MGHVRFWGELAVPMRTAGLTPQNLYTVHKMSLRYSLV